MRTIREKNILSAINPLPLTIRITVDGMIDVRITGQENAIINVTDPIPLTIKYMSFSSWGNTEGKWFFDCAGDSDDRLDEVLIRHRSAIQIFRESLFAEYDINIMPTNLSRIDWAFNLKYADFDGKKSQLLARGKFKAVIYPSNLSMTWTVRVLIVSLILLFLMRNDFYIRLQTWFDPKLVWNPQNFSEIDSVYTQAANIKIWTPHIRLLK